MTTDLFSFKLESPMTDTQAERLSAQTGMMIGNLDDPDKEMSGLMRFANNALLMLARGASNNVWHLRAFTGDVRGTDQVEAGRMFVQLRAMLPTIATIVDEEKMAALELPARPGGWRRILRPIKLSTIAAAIGAAGDVPTVLPSAPAGLRVEIRWPSEDDDRVRLAIVVQDADALGLTETAGARIALELVRPLPDLGLAWAGWLSGPDGSTDVPLTPLGAEIALTASAVTLDDARAAALVAWAPGGLLPALLLTGAPTET